MRIRLYVMQYQFFFHFNAAASTDIYILSLHDALPILPPDDVAWTMTSGAGTWATSSATARAYAMAPSGVEAPRGISNGRRARSEEHTSELQSLRHLVFRLLLEKK